MSRMPRIAAAATLASGLAIAAYAQDTPTQRGDPGMGSGMMGDRGMMGGHGMMDHRAMMGAMPMTGGSMMDHCGAMMQGMNGAPNSQWRHPATLPNKG